MDIDDHNTVDLACTRGDLLEVKQLIEHGSIGTSKAIENASFYGYLHIVDYLLKQGYVVTSTAIHNAVKDRDFRCFRMFLRYGYTHYVTPTTFNLASQYGCFSIIQYLFEFGYYQKLSKEKTEKVLELAAKFGYVSIVNFLIEQGCEVTFYAIHNAACYGHGCVLKSLYVAQVWTPNTITHLIDHTARKGQFECLKFLFEQGSSNTGTRSAVEWAAKNGNMEMLKYLIQNGNPPGSYATISYAADKNLEMVKYLVDMGYSEPDVTQVYNCAVNTSAESGKMEILKYLIEKGFKGTSGSIYGASIYGHLDCIKYLVDIGYSGTSLAIDFAAEYGHRKIVEYLHLNGYIGTSNAIDRAARHGHLKIIKYLISNGYTGTSNAIEYAAEKGHSKIVKYLLSKGWNK